MGTRPVPCEDEHMESVRVLIVDDQKPFREASHMVVEMTDGFEVVGEAENGEEAVVMASDLRPDLVLLTGDYVHGAPASTASRRLAGSCSSIHRLGCS